MGCPSPIRNRVDMTAEHLPNASISVLRERANILAKIRKFFDEQGFFEVQTPILSRDTVVDQTIDPVQTSLQVGGTQITHYLQTSPEFAMKRIMAAGAPAIYQICSAVRADEIGDHHNLEFTILEWYRAGDSYHAGMDLLDQFAQQLMGVPPARRLTFFDAIREFCGVDFFTLEASQAIEQLAEIAGSKADLFETIMVEKIEPALAEYPSVILYDWPENQAALAEVRPVHGVGIQRVAERFELYLSGCEIANGYHELCDAEVLLNRNTENNQARKQAGRDTLPSESRLLEAMRFGLPKCCGVALGVDRLVMLALGKDSIRDVMAFDSMRA